VVALSGVNVAAVTTPLCSHTRSEGQSDLTPLTFPARTADRWSKTAFDRSSGRYGSDSLIDDQDVTV
jgi:hypothetical protein